MIIGLASREYKGKTLYSMTSSTNKFLNEIKTQIKEINNSNKENNLKEMFKNALQYFDEKNNKINPDYIIIYREGGNEYRNKSLAIDELRSFTEKMKSLKSNKLYLQTKLYYICTFSRTELKFYQIKEKYNYGNPASGIVVDENIVQKDRYEFYLQPQTISQGTANPTQFQVMYYDKNEDNPDEFLTRESLEKLSFYLCYYYWTWPGAIRVPAILKMAIISLEFCFKCGITNKAVFDKPIYI